MYFSNIAEVVVGTLPNLQHGIGGSLEILSTTRIRLKDFSYDGQGPGMSRIMKGIVTVWIVKWKTATLLSLLLLILANFKCSNGSSSNREYNHSSRILQQRGHEPSTSP